MMNSAPEKLMAAMKAIAEYIEKKKPQTLPEAQHMLALIGVIASEIMEEIKEPA